MICKSKAIGLAALLVAALAAVGASSASAAQFTIEPGTILTGQEVPGVNAVYTGDFPKVSCKKINWPGEVKQVETSGGTKDTVLTLVPEFAECEAGGVKTTIEMTGCDLVLFAGGTLNNQCPAGKQIDINEAELCTITFLPQEAVPKVTYTEDPNDSKSLILDITEEGLQYTEHGTFCASQNVLTKNGSFTAQVTVKGENTLGNQVPLTRDP